MPSVANGINNHHIKAIRTTYKGVEFKSRFESEIAMLLDKMGLGWQYEPKSFLLPSGHYMPDFYIPSLRLWIEARGYDGKDWQIDQFKEHVKVFQEEYLVFKSNSNELIAIDADGKYVLDSQPSFVHIGSCRDCGKISFLSFDVLGKICPHCKNILYFKEVAKAYSEQGRIKIQDPQGKYSVVEWPGFKLNPCMDFAEKLRVERSSADLQELMPDFYEMAFKEIKTRERELEFATTDVDRMVSHDVIVSERRIITKLVDQRTKKIMRRGLKDVRAGISDISNLLPDELTFYNEFKDLLTKMTESIYSKSEDA